MPCDYCYPDVIDYGFNESDHVSRFVIETDQTDEYKYIDIKKVRKYFECSCEQGMDYKVQFSFALEDGRGFTGKSRSEAEALLKVVAPEAKFDIDWAESQSVYRSEMGMM